MKRRDFFKYSMVGAGVPATLKFGQIPVWATDKELSLLAENDDRILIVLQMFGGNDGLNTIIPADDDRYYNKYRKNIGIPKSQLFRLSGTKSYMNPALQKGLDNGMLGLFDEGKLAVIQGVGYPKPNLSHFRSTDIWMGAKTPPNDTERIDSGWLGNFANTLAKENAAPNCINVGNSASLIFQADNDNLAVTLEDPQNFYEQGKDILSGETMLQEDTYFADERNFLVDLSQKSNKYSAVVKTAFDAGKNTVKYVDQKLSNELKLVSRLISGGLKTKIYLVSIDGFDTHADQGNVYGKHSNLLTNISNAVSSFMADLKAQNLEKKVVGMTISEFGRRPEDNGSGGTDHGAASVMFMFGEAVNGKTFGTPMNFDKLDSNKDFVHQFDFRQVYDEVLFKWLGANNSQVENILTKRYDKVEDGLLFVQKPLANEPIITQKPKFYPNPSINGQTNVEFTLTRPSAISVSQTSLSGISFQILPEINLPTGRHNFPLFLQGQKGIYVLSIVINGEVFIEKMLVD